MIVGEEGEIVLYAYHPPRTFDGFYGSRAQGPGLFSRQVIAPVMNWRYFLYCMEAAQIELDKIAGEELDHRQTEWTVFRVPPVGT